MAGVPGLTVIRSSSSPRWPWSTHLPRPGRACPGHPRGAAPEGDAGRSGALGGPRPNGSAWVAGTSPARTEEAGESLRGVTQAGGPAVWSPLRPAVAMVDTSPPSWPGLSRPPTRCRFRGRCGEVGRSRRPRHHGSAWVAGTSPARTEEASEGPEASHTPAIRPAGARSGPRWPWSGPLPRPGRACPGQDGGRDAAEPSCTPAVRPAQAGGAPRAWRMPRSSARPLRRPMAG